MSYLSQIEKDIHQMFDETSDEYIEQELVKYVKSKVLESYKNGLQTGRGGRKVKPRSRKEE
jgi:hypothetical protein